MAGSLRSWAWLRLPAVQPSSPWESLVPDGESLWMLSRNELSRFCAIVVGTLLWYRFDPSWMDFSDWLRLGWVSDGRKGDANKSKQKKKRNDHELTNIMLRIAVMPVTVISVSVLGGVFLVFSFVCISYWALFGFSCMLYDQLKKQVPVAKWTIEVMLSSVWFSVVCKFWHVAWGYPTRWVGYF